MKSVNVSTHSPMGPPLPPRPILPPIVDVRIRPRYTTRPTFSYYPQPAASTLIHMLQPGNADPSVTRCNACLRSLQDLVKQSFELVVRESPECAALMNAVSYLQFLRILIMTDFGCGCDSARRQLVLLI